MLTDVYSAYQQFHTVCQIKQIYGPEHARSISSYPHIVWVPTSDTYSADRTHIWQNVPVVKDGKHWELEACFSRGCGVDLYLYHKNYQELEELINTVINALYDVLISTGNFRVNQGRMLNREEVTENTVGYVLSCTLYVPIYRLLPVGIVESFTETITITPQIG